ncbi:hypothetical protein K4F52_007700 [Lecanicillium sp. MT-2017a]|nr:hypothetical protein K4F52_007700 [Lecanicillium sp. MT-2017a]
MATMEAPTLPRANSIFELPHKKWRRRRVNSAMIERQEKEAATREAEAESRARASEYLTSFLLDSPWNDQLDQISIIWDSVPPMEELELYGELDEQQGTRNCRRLFKAVVVWDDLGHLLWKTLKEAADQRPEPLHSHTTPPSPSPKRESLDACDAINWWPSPAFNSRRASQETSHSGSGVSRGSITANSDSFAREYSTTTSFANSPFGGSASSLSCNPGSYPEYKSTSAESVPMERKGSDSITAMIPRAISQSCVSAVRKTFSVFGGEKNNS